MKCADIRQYSQKPVPTAEDEQTKKANGHQPLSFHFHRIFLCGYIFFLFSDTMANASRSITGKKGKPNIKRKNCAICNRRATIFHQRNLYGLCVFQHATFFPIFISLFFYLCFWIRKHLSHTHTNSVIMMTIIRLWITLALSLFLSQFAHWCNIFNMTVVACALF